MTKKSIKNIEEQKLMKNIEKYLEEIIENIELIDKGIRELLKENGEFMDTLKLKNGYIRYFGGAVIRMNYQHVNGEGYDVYNFKIKEILGEKSK